ncbi:DUF952 domain-containing protein [Paraflavitalea speifideaquila]|uniref:DUF952 domain-containing protein n=1 Tax=Paraflavitalea speifideaquila TaxID=3076558 RepID=UPI0028EC3004|nr:DUF952 domain-containing protein [Paraflavitalea speifideiaquila]
MATIYHITTQAEWDAATPLGFYEAASLKDEGFIHCSQAEQIPGVLDRYFKGKTNLVKLVIDTDKLTSQLIYEWSPSIADTFPHIYGLIITSAVVAFEQI